MVSKAVHPTSLFSWIAAPVRRRRRENPVTPDSKKPRPLGRLLLLVLLLGAGAFAALKLWSYGTSTTERTARAPAPVPVTFATATTADFPVYLNGLGTVQPYQTVTLRSRVDGQVMKVGFRQGQMVKEGQVLVQIDPRPYQAALEQAKAKKAQDEATLHNAKLDLQRYQTLVSRDAGSRQQLDTQQATVGQLTAQVQGDQAAIDNAETQLGYTTIKSPLTGMVGFRQIDPGNIVHASDTTGIVTVVKLQPISVVFTAPEEQIQRINQALARGVVPVTALSSDGTKTLAQGHLALVNNQIDQASGTIQMKATFDNQDNALWPGLSVLTRLLLETLKQVVVVPNGAIQRGPDGFYVYVINSQDQVAVSPIKVGEEGERSSVVTTGIGPGERVVTAGQYRLTPGMRVTPHDSDRAPLQAPASGTPYANAAAQNVAAREAKQRIPAGDRNK
jgi:membrane fusion protein, multidrug efflux system